MLPTIAIVVLNWNGWKITLKCVESLLNLQIPNKFRISVIICDNGSTDNSVVEISMWINTHNLLLSKKDFISCILLQNATNLGYAGGMNVGIKHALKFDTKFVWLLNNDTHVTAGALVNLMVCANEHANVAIFGSTICEYTNPLLVKSAGGCRYNHLFTTYYAIGSGVELSKVMTWNTNLHLDYIDGSAWLIRREVLDTVGLLNEDYFLYFEELDYAHRIRKYGWQLKWCKNSIVYHQGGASSMDYQTSLNPRHTSSYHADLSAFKFTWNHHRRILWLAMIARIGGRIIKIISSGNWYLINSLWCSYKDFLYWKPSNNFIHTE